MRFEIETEQRVILECNCSMCTKKGFLHLIIESHELRLVQGEAEQSEYRFGTGVARHFFCRSCGIHAYYVPRSHPDGYSVNFRCLDDAAALRDSFEFRAFEGARWEDNIHLIR